MKERCHLKRMFQDGAREGRGNVLKRGHPRPPTAPSNFTKCGPTYDYKMCPGRHATRLSPVRWTLTKGGSRAGRSLSGALRQRVRSLHGAAAGADHEVGGAGRNGAELVRSHGSVVSSPVWMDGLGIRAVGGSACGVAITRAEENRGAAGACRPRGRPRSHGRGGGRPGRSCGRFRPAAGRRRCRP